MSTKFAQNFLPHMKKYFVFLEETAPFRAREREERGEL